jgi:membrane protease subunit (stomatin/prohibitin family)
LVLKSGNGTTLDTLVLTITVIKDTGIISGSKINTGTTKIGMFFQEGTVVGVNLVRGKYTVSVYDIFGNSIWQTAGYAATPNKYLIDLNKIGILRNTPCFIKINNGGESLAGKLIAK